MEFRTAGHPERRPSIVREYENRGVIRRLVAPPTLPRVVGPRSSHRPEHVPAEDPGAEAGESERCHIVVDSRLTVRLSVHLAPHARLEEPLHQLGSVHAERMLEILIRPGAVTV